MNDLHFAVANQPLIATNPCDGQSAPGSTAPVMNALLRSFRHQLASFQMAELFAKKLASTYPAQTWSTVVHLGNSIYFAWQHDIGCFYEEHDAEIDDKPLPYTLAYWSP